MEAAESLLSQAPPSDLPGNLKCLSDLLLGQNDAVESLRSKHYIPFSVKESAENGEKPFLTCQYNQIAPGEYRSPWATAAKEKERLENKQRSRQVQRVTSISVRVEVEPAAVKNDEEQEDEEEEELRRFELTFNEVLDSYKSLYYGHESVASVFLNHVEDGSFEGLFGIHKTTSAGSWDSVSIVHVGEPSEDFCTYKVETSVLVVLGPAIDGDSEACTTRTDISVTASKTVTKDCKLFPDKIPLTISHIENIGTLIEANEIDLRSNLEKVLIPKNQETLDSVLKEKKDNRPQVNPLMHMVMGSDMLKKKLSREAEKASVSECVVDDVPRSSAHASEASSAVPKKPLYGRPPGGVNPLAGMAINPGMLKKQLSKK